MSDNDHDYFLQDVFDLLVGRVRKMNTAEKKHANIDKMYAEAVQEMIAHRVKMMKDLARENDDAVIGMVKELIEKGGPVRTRWASDETYGETYDRRNG
jgi:hypothetical protein